SHAVIKSVGEGLAGIEHLVGIPGSVGGAIFGNVFGGGRDIGSAEGYRYSKALAGMDGAWTLSGLDGFLTNPRKWAPGTKMVYQGLRDPQDRIDVITYLNEADGTPSDLASE
ncbi:MAG: hypothetical protein AAFU49_23905, partial [Pseudomonadota bacterium]